MTRICSLFVGLSAVVCFIAGCGDDSGSTGSNSGKSGEDDCLRFQYLSGHFEPPSNIVVLFGLETCDGKPKPGIKADQFVIGEDVAGFSVEAEAIVLPTEMGFRLVSVLLLDMSGSIAVSGNVSKLKTAAKDFVDNLEGSHDVLLFTFDGRQELQPLLAVDQEGLVGAIDALGFPECESKAVCPADAPVCHKGFCVGDPSTNLNGALEKGLSVLDDQEMQTPEEAIFAGSLVVFTDGTDQAGIIHNEVAVGMVNGSVHSIFSIGLGGEVDKNQLEALGKDGTAIAEDAEQISTAFDKIAQVIEERASRFYVVGYCSPKRAGEHTLNLSVEGFSGAPLVFPFNADGFEAGCDAEMISDPCGGKDCSQPREQQLFSGSWVLKTELNGDTDIFGGMPTQLVNLFTVEFLDDVGQLSLSFCGRTVEMDTGGLGQTQLSQNTIEKLAETPIVLQLTDEGELSSQDVLWTWGLKDLDNPTTDPLPTSADDIHVWDQDADGHAGVSVEVLQPEGVRSVVRRSLWTIQDATLSDDHNWVVGEMTFQIDEVAVGVSSPILMNVGEFVDSGEQPSLYVLRRVEETGMSCAELLVDHQGIFQGAPAP